MIISLFDEVHFFLYYLAKAKQHRAMRTLLFLIYACIPCVQCSNKTKQGYELDEVIVWSFPSFLFSFFHSFFPDLHHFYLSFLSSKPSPIPFLALFQIYSPI